MLTFLACTNFCVHVDSAVNDGLKHVCHGGACGCSPLTSDDRRLVLHSPLRQRALVADLTSMPLEEFYLCARLTATRALQGPAAQLRVVQSPGSRRLPGTQGTCSRALRRGCCSSHRAENCKKASGLRATDRRAAGSTSGSGKRLQNTAGVQRFCGRWPSGWDGAQ